MQSRPTARYGDPLPREALPEPYGGFRQPRLEGAALGLCATEAEARALVERGSGLRIVALTPQAAGELQVVDEPYLALEDFYDITALREADEPLLREQALWSDAVDEAAWRIEPVLETGGFRPAGLAFFNLKVAVDGLYRAAFAIAHLMLARPGEVVAFEQRAPAPPPDTLYWTELPERAVLEPLAAAAGVPVTTLPAVAEPPSVETGSTEGESALSQQLRLLREHGPVRRARALAGARRPDLLYAGGSDVSLTAEQLRDHGWRAAPVSRMRGGTGPSVDWARAWRRLPTEARLFSQARWCGIDFGPLIESRLRHWWHALVPRMWDSMHAGIQQFERRRPRALLFSTPWTPEEHGALQAGRALGIPVATFQHGGFEGNCEYTIYDRTDLRFSDARLAYGEATARYFAARNEAAAEPRGRPVAVGSPRLDRVPAEAPPREEVRGRLGLDSEVPLVLYVPTSYQYAWYATRQAYIPVDYFRTLQRAIEALERSGVAYIYKPFPQGIPDPAERVVRTGRIVSDMPFTELLRAFDAVVFDIPSTAMLEAMQTD